jgi:hydrogenase-4 component D
MLALLVITLLAPFVGALFAGLTRGRMSHFVAILTSGITLFAAAETVLAIYSRAPVRYDFLAPALPWLSKVPIFGLALDSLGSVMLIGITLIGFLVVIYSGDYLSARNAEHPYHKGNPRYFFWLLLFIGSMVGVALSPNLLQMFVFWELTTLCSWALISHTQEEKALRSGFKALIMTHLGGLAFIVVLMLTYAFTGSFDFSSLGQLAAPLKAAAFILLLAAAWAKSAQIPFHTWLPDAMEAPSPISAYLHGAAMVKAGVYLIARLLISGLNLPAGLGLLMAVMALLTMFMAVLAYFRQDDLKRLLAYSTIVHLSYIFVGLSLGVIGSTAGYQGAVLHILCHGAAKATLFLCAGSIAYSAGTRRISDLRGLASKRPLEGVVYLIGVLAVTGVPPFAGFWSKFLIFVGALESPGGWALLVLLVAESVISFGWLLWIGQKIFLGKPSEAASAAGNPPPAMTAVLVVGMVLCLAMPIIGIPLVQGLLR